MIGANGCLTWHSEEACLLYCRWASPLEGWIIDSHTEVSPPLL